MVQTSAILCFKAQVRAQPLCLRWPSAQFRGHGTISWPRVPGWKHKMAASRLHRAGSPAIRNAPTKHSRMAARSRSLVSTSQIYCLHGDLACAIAARHLKERVESMERRDEQLRIEVFAIVKDMLDRGERPVQARVRKMLSADSLKARRTLRRCLNEAIS